jgi:hypothetical protein
MKIIDSRPANCNPNREVMGSEVPVGTTFYATHFSVGYGLYLRTYAEVVRLESPDNTWTPMYFKCTNYQPVEAHVVVTKAI